MIQISKRGATVGVMTGLIAGALGVAVATVGGVWTASTSTGNGYGKALQMTVSTTTVAGDATANLYPGATGKSLYVKVSNSNPFSIDVNSVATSASSTVTSADTGACASATVTVSPTATTGTLTGQTIASGGTLVIAVPAALSMAGDAVNTCQGVAFGVDHITVNATQTSS